MLQSAHGGSDVRPNNPRAYIPRTDTVPECCAFVFEPHEHKEPNQHPDVKQPDARACGWVTASNCCSYRTTDDRMPSARGTRLVELR
jgi:hypothetical protein